MIISNVKDVKIYKHYLYFTAMGEVEICFDFKDIYRNFAIIIKSKQFSIDELKQQAILDIVNNNFDLNSSKIFKKYIKIIEKVLNISIFNEKLTIKPNKFKLSFELAYKLNNKIKRINISQ